MPANFKSFEAQSRLLAAVVAAHPGLKLDYRAISQHYGSDMTTSAVEHRFRPVKKQAEVLRKFVAQGVDTKNVDITDKDEIAKYFGESTPDGIQFQFRSIKKDADSLRAAVNNGENPASIVKTPKKSATPATPRKRGPKAVAATPSSRGSSGTATPGARTTSASKRKVSRPSYKEISKDDSLTDVDYDELDKSPTQSICKKMKTTPNTAGADPRFPIPVDGYTMTGALPPPVPAQAFVASAPGAAPAMQITAPSPAVTALQATTVAAPAVGPVGGSVPSPTYTHTPSDSDFSVQTPTRQQTAPLPLSHKPEESFGSYHIPDYSNDPAMSFLNSDASLGGFGGQPFEFSNDFAFGASDDEDTGEI